MSEMLKEERTILKISSSYSCKSDPRRQEQLGDNRRRKEQHTI